MLSKVLLNRLSEILKEVIHPDQTDCVSGQIFDNTSFIRDIMDIGQLFDIDFG